MRVEASKNKIDLGASAQRRAFLSTWRLSSTYSRSRAGRYDIVSGPLDTQQVPVTEDEGRFR